MIALVQEAAQAADVSLMNGDTCYMKHPGRNCERKRRRLWLAMPACVVLLFNWGVCSPLVPESWLSPGDWPIVREVRAASAGTKSFESPVRLCAFLNRQSPQTAYTSKELDFIATAFDMVVGLDGHGYDFPGVVAEVRKRNANLTILAHADTMAIQPHGDRFAALDVEEEVFWHSADPAGLHVRSNDARGLVCFRQDARARSMSRHYSCPGVKRYHIEVGTGPEGPFRALVEPLEESGVPFYVRAVRALRAAEHVRVRTELADGRIVAYSWAGQPELAPTALLLASPAPGDRFVVLCDGPDCPEQAEEVALVCDFDGTGRFGDSRSGAIPARQPAQARRSWAGLQVYEGEFRKPAGRHVAYRAEVARTQLSAPAAGESYQSGDYNNRIQMPQFGAFLVRPSHAQWRAQLDQRLRDALRAGFNGINLDFAFDSFVPPTWKATSAPARALEAEHGKLPAAVESLLGHLAQRHPRAKILFNGLFTVQNAENYHRYVRQVTGAGIEFFAFGVDPDATEIDARTGEALLGLWKTRQAERLVVARAGGRADNTAARLTSLALYLLLADEHTYYAYQTDTTTQDLPYFPEWDVPLGDPLEQIDDLADVVDPARESLAARQFANGWVYFNAAKSETTVQLPARMQRVAIRGGLSDRLGGNGALKYTEVDRLMLRPGEAAILLRTLPPGN